MNRLSSVIICQHFQKFNKIFIVPMYAGDFQSFTMFFLPHVLLFSAIGWLCRTIFILLAGYIPGIMFRLGCGFLRQK